jgi:hypothetical protein
VTPPNPANTTSQPGIFEYQGVVVVFTFWGAAVLFYLFVGREIKNKSTNKPTK